MLLICLWLPTAAAWAYDYAEAPEPLLELGSVLPGKSPAHQLSFNLGFGELETYRTILTYPDGFRFNGFLALGPANTPVGTYELDFDFDGVPDHRITVRALSWSRAYADVLEDGRYSPDLEPAIDADHSEFFLRQPYGGDVNPNTLTLPHPARGKLILLPGLITSPAAVGNYTVRGDFVSVDPDSDGPDDGVGTAPLARQFDLTVTIAGAVSDAPFARFKVDRAEVRGKPGARQRIDVRGRYQLGTGSDGLDLANERVTVRVADWSQTIPGTALLRTKSGYRYRSHGDGIHKLELYNDGRFVVECESIALTSAHIKLPVPFSLRLGNDFGETTIRFHRNGNHRWHDTPER